jgi:squalene-hopene/tetraprenyl-beta-curcumene cyclase
VDGGVLHKLNDAMAQALDVSPSSWPPRLQALPAPSILRQPPSAVCLPALDRAIEHGRLMVLERQGEDGSWRERCNMGPLPTALSLVALHHAGELSVEDRGAGARWLRSRQLADGSFEGRPFAREGDLATTGVAWAALTLSAERSDRDAARRARAYVDAKGGVDAIVRLAENGDVAAIAAVALTMAGLVDSSRIPAMPLSILLVPGLVERLSQRVAFVSLTTALSVSLIVRGLGGAGQRGKLGRGLTADRERVRAIELLTLYQNDNGSLMNAVCLTALLLPALRGAGVSPDDRRFSRAAAWLRARGQRNADGLFFDMCGSDVWSTASYLRALLSTGSARSDEPVTRAVRWLLAQQCSRPHPAISRPGPGVPRVGGWGFQSGEEHSPDCDTTALVVDALGLALTTGVPEDPGLPPSLAARAHAAIASARAWLGAMQNDDGGWPSFFWGHRTKRPGPIMTRPLRLRFGGLPRSEPTAWMRALADSTEHLSDPSTEYVTARVIAGLARTGTAPHASEAQGARQFLARQQCPSGAWWGRWKVNYLPATAAAVTALARLGEGASAAGVRQALWWIESRQNLDGGFGESIASYRDASLAGCGPSAAPTTAAVLLGLIEAGEGTSTPAVRAAAFLVEGQRADGAWDNGECVSAVAPPNLFYVDGGAARCAPLEALGRYRVASTGE